MPFVVEEKDSTMAVVIRLDSSLDPVTFEEYKEPGDFDDSAPIDVEPQEALTEEEQEKLEEEESEADTNYDMYLRTMDESYLTFKEGVEPSRFVMRKVIDWKTSQRLKDAAVTVKGRKMDYKAASSFMREIRACLIDIKHPEGVDPGEIAFKKDRDGLPSLELMSKLDTYGVIENLYEARQKHLKDPLKLKKK